MNLQLFLFTFVITLFGILSLQAEDKRPNIIFMLADDLGWTDFGYYGSDDYETPNIDKLSASGMKFANGHPACTDHYKSGSVSYTHLTLPTICSV